MTSGKCVAIIGAGPAGLAAYDLLKKVGTCKVELFERGPDLKERLERGDLINGKGGAGLWSDRKFSGGCAGTGLLKTSPYMLRESFMTVTQQMKDALPEMQQAIDELRAATFEVLGDQDVSSEELDRRLSDFFAEQSHKFAKLYPSLVLPDFSCAQRLISMYDTSDAHFNTKIVDIEEVGCKYQVTYEDCSTWKWKRKVFDYVILAMGRFGSLQSNEFALFAKSAALSCPVRLEIGVRVNIDLYPPLKQALLKVQSDRTMIADPKFKLTRSFMIGGKLSNFEFRSFCVCLPTDGSSGYLVETRDENTTIATWSGSSSAKELQDRQSDKVVKGSNLGIMMRTCDPYVIQRFEKDINHLKAKKSAACLSGTVSGIDETIDFLEEYYPRELCYPLYDGLMEMLYNICGQSVNEELTLYAPCLEGVGSYPNVNPSTYHLRGHPHVSVVGDQVGHTRGLLQAAVMGHTVAEAVITQDLELHLREAGLLHNYQSIFLPSFSYNKTLPSLHQGYDYWANLYQRLETCFPLSVQELDWSRYNEICTKLHRVHFTGDSSLIDVIYEIHHFFLDKKVYGQRQQLHYISQKAMLEYILLCNVVEANKKVLRKAVLQHIDVSLDLSHHQFKSCVLALRTRASLEERLEFHDIPVMQSAFKLMYKADTETQIKIVACVCTLLDTFFKKAVEEAGLDLMLVRSKIETQEPSVESVTGKPLYLECHVKVNINQVDGGKVDYSTKKLCIQELANVFEGQTALVQEVFKVMGVSINLLKHREYGQQFFLTYRTDTKEQMCFIRQHWKEIMDHSLQLLPHTSILKKYKFTFFPDAEFVVFDDNRDLDKPWFPVTQDFLQPGYKQAVADLCSPKKLIVVSDNADKVREIAQFLQTPCVRVSVPQMIQHTWSLKESAIQKVLAGYKLYNRPVLAESTGLYIEGMNQYPGSYTKDVINSIGERGLIRLADASPVKAVTVVAYHDGQQVHTFRGQLDGTLQETDISHDGGFGWDNIFYPSGSLLPLSALPTDTKHMRRDALIQLSTLFQ